MSASTGFYMHPASPLHDTGWAHPEHQGRLRALSSTVGKDMLALVGKVEQRECPDATPDDLLLVHTQEHVAYVRDMCHSADVQQKVLPLDPDTRVSPASWQAALGSAGATMEAARAVADGRLRSAFVAARPPGHHATPHRPMGFCLFNNVAVTARHLQATGRARRILIVDWDVHHGNGTQDAFYDDPTVFYLSLHQSPWFPGTGKVSETGRGSGTGTTLNVPLPAGTPRDAYMDVFHRSLDRALSDFTPDFMLVSSGFDALAGDPLGGQLLEPEDFHQMAKRTVEVADSVCGGRVVCVLEGGYEPARLGQATVEVIRALAGLEGR
ncbi:MAG: histone deacetylase [Gemmatimonadetes bacterium]|nr:histone deacetylase [Gemmatimonadota bacterium]